jgi:hypothetical protein
MAANTPIAIRTIGVSIIIMASVLNLFFITNLYYIANLILTPSIRSRENNISSR